MNNLKNDKNITMDSRVSAVCGSINFKEFKHCDLPKIIVELESKLLNSREWVENYYLIFHDDTETPHIHYIIELCGSIRIKTILNKLENLGYNRESVNIGKLGYLSSMLKYFLHLTDDSLEEGKKIYPIDSIISNMSYEFISNYIECFDDVMSQLSDYYNDDELDAIEIKLINHERPLVRLPDEATYEAIKDRGEI